MKQQSVDAATQRLDDFMSAFNAPAAWRSGVAP
jgi:hypothetical protein